jgi:hypothetical protein
VRSAGYDDRLERGWFWDAEILLRAQKEKMRIMEFGVDWKEGGSSSFNLKRELRIIRYMLKFRFRL